MNLYAIKFIVSTELSEILLNNIPLDDIINLFSICQLLTADDLKLLSLSPSDHLKKQLLLVHSQHFKITIWPMICDTLYNSKSTLHIGIQLMNGKYLTLLYIV